MATFPSILVQPFNRTYDLQRDASSAATMLTGVQVQYKHGPRVGNAPFSFVFTNLRLAQADQISAHYREQKQHKGFQIPQIIWASHPSLYDVTSASQEYRYSAPPRRSTNQAGLYDVTVEFVTMF